MIGGGQRWPEMTRDTRDKVVQRGTPVDLRLLCERRLLPALIGQVRESSGKATKEADLADKPALLGRILSHKQRQDMRFGKHMRASSPGVLTTPDGWRLYGLAAPPPEPASQKRGGQSLLGFTRSAAAGDGGGGGGGGGAMGGGAVACVGEESLEAAEAEVARLTAEREKIGAAAGATAGEPPLLHNHAAALANAMRRLDAARRKSGRA